jgi:AcrR family transcriptional regulator
VDRSARERLLREAAALFSCRSYAGTPVGEIVAAAGVTKPVLYYHFKSKEGLYLAIMDDALAKLRPAVDASLRDDGTDATDRIRGLCGAIVACALENLDVVRLIRSLHHCPPQGVPEFDAWEFPLTIRATLTRIVAEGVRARQIARVAPEDLVWTVLGLVNVCVDSNLADARIALSADGFRAALDLVLAAVAPPDAAPSRPAPAGHRTRKATSRTPRRPKTR